MDWMYLFYFALAILLFFGASGAGRGRWQEDFTSLKQSKMLQGVTTLGIALHHLAQKSCAPWHPKGYIVHGLDPFIPMGYMFVGVFLFCSAMGLYKSRKIKPGYLKGFFRRRVLPVVIAFYLSEFLYTGVRLLMGEKMDPLTIVWYLSGLHMANFNAWYIIVIPFFYLVFWAAFRFCRREGTAIFWVFLFTLGYTVLGAFIDHQNDWWMRGEWWYNSIILFPLGLVFARHEAGITRVLKKGYWFWLLLAFAGFFLLFQQSEWLINNRWGYYGEWGDPLKVQHRLMSAGIQWLVAIFYVAFCFLLTMKVRIGNKVLGWLGGMTLDFYLMHGIFVELFGYNFLDLTDSIVYIRNVPLFIVAVLACSVPAAWLFSLLRRALTARLLKSPPPPGDSAAPPREKRGLFSRHRDRGDRSPIREKGRLRRLSAPLITVLLLGGYFLFLQSGQGDGRTRVLADLSFRAPEEFALQRADSRSALWKYTGTKQKVSLLILDTEIPDANSRNLESLEKIMEACDWLTDREYYLNPQGVRMVRCFADYSGSAERRYYIDNGKGRLLLIRMNENPRFYNPEECEEAMRQTADSVRPV